jgi:hypothetical protein
MSEKKPNLIESIVNNKKFLPCYTIIVLTLLGYVSIKENYRDQTKYELQKNLQKEIAINKKFKLDLQSLLQKRQSNAFKNSPFSKNYSEYNNNQGKMEELYRVLRHKDTTIQPIRIINDFKKNEEICSGSIITNVVLGFKRVSSVLHCKKNKSAKDIIGQILVIRNEPDGFTLLKLNEIDGYEVLGPRVKLNSKEPFCKNQPTDSTIVEFKGSRTVSNLKSTIAGNAIHGNSGVQFNSLQGKCVYGFLDGEINLPNYKDILIFRFDHKNRNFIVENIIKVKD